MVQSPGLKGSGMHASALGKGRCLKDHMALKNRGPIPIYYESLYGI